MPARTEITEFAVGALVGSVVLAAIVHARGFRWLCLVGLACGSLYVLASLGVDGLIGWAEGMVAMAGTHPAFFLGMAFGKFAQGLLTLGPLRAGRRRR
ncbi:MAG: hypothetical protein OXU81_06065 [Gammaproteobacteria bacterium]|nr:hypothetical protein [Gammaproteobacteria bacterium]